MSKEIPVRVGRMEKMSNGGVIRMDYLDPAYARRDRVNPSATARHETDHGVVTELTGGTVLEMAIRSAEPGVNGFVRTLGSHPIGAAASFGNGHGGSSWDRFIVESQGLDADALGRAAHAVAESAHDEREEVAKMIEVEKVATGGMVREAMKDGKEGRKVVLSIFDSEGRKINETRMRAKDGIAIVQDMEPEIEYQMPFAA